MPTTLRTLLLLAWPIVISRATQTVVGLERTFNGGLTSFGMEGTYTGPQGSGVFSVVCMALFLRFVWHPKTRFLLKADREALAKAGKSTSVRQRNMNFSCGTPSRKPARYK